MSEMNLAERQIRGELSDFERERQDDPEFEVKERVPGKRTITDDIAPPDQWALGEANDSLEREADDAAAHIERGQTLPALSTAAAPRTQRRSRRDPVTSLVGEVIAAGGGTPLSPAVKRKMEASFASDFGDVRLHTDAAAASAAASIGAQAFTTGTHIYLSPSYYQPGTRRGERLLAHELTHTIQQRSRASVQRKLVQARFIAGDSPAAEAMIPHDLEQLAQAPAAAAAAPVEEAGAPPSNAEAIEALVEELKKGGEAKAKERYEGAGPNQPVVEAAVKKAFSKDVANRILGRENEGEDQGNNQPSDGGEGQNTEARGDEAQPSSQPAPTGQQPTDRPADAPAGPVNPQGDAVGQQAGNAQGRGGQARPRGRGDRGGGQPRRRGGADRGPGAAVQAQAAPQGQGPAAPATSQPEGLAGLSSSDLELVNGEIAEHQQWASARENVGEAWSGDRLLFALGNVAQGGARGAATGLLYGAGGAMAGQLIKRVAGRVPGLGPAIGGLAAGYNLYKAWGKRAEISATIGKFGQGADIYETLANSIASVSEALDLAINIMRVVAGIVGIISAVIWLITILTVGVAAPLAGTLSAIAAGIMVGTDIADLINTRILQPCVLLFRVLHTMNSEADPRDVEAQGEGLSAAAEKVGMTIGQLTGEAAGKALGNRMGLGGAQGGAPREGGAAPEGGGSSSSADAPDAPAPTSRQAAPDAPDAPGPAPQPAAPDVPDAPGPSVGEPRRGPTGTLIGMPAVTEGVAPTAAGPARGPTGTLIGMPAATPHQPTPDVEGGSAPRETPSADGGGATGGRPSLIDRAGAWVETKAQGHESGSSSAARAVKAGAKDPIKGGLQSAAPSVFGERRGGGGQGGERANPRYEEMDNQGAPPASPQQIRQIQDEIRQILTARREAGQVERESAADQQYSEGQVGQIQAVRQQGQEAEQATQEHQQQVQQRQAANQQQQQQQRETQERAADYNNQASQLSVIKTPLRVFGGMASLGARLPERAGGSAFRRMSANCDQLTGAFRQADERMAQQQTGGPAAAEGIQRNAQRIQATQTAAATTGQQLQQSSQGVERLQQQNQQAIQRASANRQQAAQQGQQLEQTAEQRRQQSQQLAQQLVQWANAHRARRESARGR